jgi:hypothetical protein
MSAIEEWSESDPKKKEAAMKRIFVAAILVFLILSPIGCGHSSSSSTPIFTSFIISDPAVDGDIEQDLFSAGTFTIRQGNTQSVSAGIDFIKGTEFRAFLDFPLGGSGGVPVNAVIDSAFLDIVIDSVSLLSGNTIPIRIDLVELPSLTLFHSDYDVISRPALASITLNIFQSDIGFHVNIDVTSLMREAQSRGLADFQIRILEDFGNVPPGLIVINDTTGVNRGDLAPFLSVNYF